MPPAPPCTRKVSPGCSPATMNTFDQTVHATSGRAAAVTRSTPSGTGITWPAGTATRSAYRRRPAARTPGRRPASRSTPSPTRRDGAAALQAEDLGGAGRRRVVALALQEVGPVDRGGGDVDQRPRRDPARGRAPRRRQDLGTTGGRSATTASRVSRRTRRRCGRPRCRRGPRRRCRRGPARRPGGPSPRPAPGACAASFSIASGSAPARRGVPEQVRRDRAPPAVDVVGRDLREVEDQGLVDLGLDVEGVAQLVDPVVQVHGPNLVIGAGPSSPTGRRFVERLTAKSRRSSQVSTSRPRRRAAGNVRERRAGPAAAQRHRRAGPRGRAARTSSRRRPTTPASCRRPSASTRHAPSTPSAAASSRRDRVRRRRAACPRPAPRPGRGVRRARRRRSSNPATGPPPGGSSRVNVDRPRRSATRAPTTTTSAAPSTRRARGRAGCGRRARARPCRRRPAAPPCRRRGSPRERRQVHLQHRGPSGTPGGRLGCHAGGAGAGGLDASTRRRTAAGCATLVPDGADLVVLPGGLRPRLRRARLRPRRRTPRPWTASSSPRSNASPSSARPRSWPGCSSATDPARRTTRVVVRGAARRRLPQDPPLRLVRLPRVRRARGRADRARDVRARRLHGRPDDLLRPAVPRARPPAGRRRCGGDPGARGLGRRAAQGRPLDGRCCAPARSRTPRTSSASGSRARATPATRWSWARSATCSPRAATTAEILTVELDLAAVAEARRTNPSLANRRL